MLLCRNMSVYKDVWKKDIEMTLMGKDYPNLKKKHRKQVPQ